jgi:hypothetical protein
VQVHVVRESEVPHLAGMIDRAVSAAISGMLETSLREERDMNGDPISDESIREKGLAISASLAESVGDRVHWNFSWNSVVCRK